MSLGVWIFSVVLGMVAMAVAMQFAMSRAARASEGKLAPELDGPLGAAVKGDTLVWFHSPTCGPCRAMEPAVEALERSGQAIIVDVSKRLDVAQAFGVMATPTTIRIRGGQIESVRTGMLRPEALAALLAD